MKTPVSPGAALVAMRWARADADRDQPRRAGLLGGRPRSCECGACAKCRAREAARRWREKNKADRKLSV
jgi:hypothetical protein